MASGYIPVLVLAVVFLLIVFRKVGNFRVKIWQAMTIGAVAVLLTMQITPIDALFSINYDVMLFLFGMFVVGESMQESGYLRTLSHRLFRGAKSVSHIVLISLFAFGLLSALLMNDTLAIVGTPVVLGLARRHSISPKLLLLTLAVAVTTGSVMSPIGNPQNLLVATSGGFTSPFISFFQYLSIPTLISLGVAFLFLRFFYRFEFKKPVVVDEEENGPIDARLVALSKIALALILLLIGVKIVLVALAPSIEMRLSYIALAAAFPILLFSQKRVQIVRSVDWSTLVFFASMFILMASVWNSGVFQDLLISFDVDVTAVPSIMVIGLTLSQLISNVPLVALYLPMLTSTGASAVQMITLAAGSTLAGNMLILGAASNVIIIQNAEKQGETLSFVEFAKIGIPLTLVQSVVYMALLLFVT
jgi:Na+/H+ antiporter NhaD/arsenite permease-like protein